MYYAYASHLYWFMKSTTNQLACLNSKMKYYNKNSTVWANVFFSLASDQQNIKSCMIATGIFLFHNILNDKYDNDKDISSGANHISEKKTHDKKQSNEDRKKKRNFAYSLGAALIITVGIFYMRFLILIFGICIWHISHKKKLRRKEITTEKEKNDAPRFIFICQKQPEVPSEWFFFLSFFFNFIFFHTACQFLSLCVSVCVL